MLMVIGQAKAAMTLAAESLRWLRRSSKELLRRSPLAATLRRCADVVDDLEAIAAAAEGLHNQVYN